MSKRIYDGYVNVSWFGAIGDGIADDRDSIQRAIDAINEGEHVQRIGDRHNDHR